jgi:hypothetical protein
VRARFHALTPIDSTIERFRAISKETLLRSVDLARTSSMQTRSGDPPIILGPLE